ncbi:BURP domain-containing protein BNM2C-like [Benincasa hispida]|uniref:BURP domain-containing protein BNM2C-like n=1 Tax=Benincasa hispida TaxID=102211 RepID=UPI001902B9BB|nr:BURP domain-containing protein BNM2C-like [Benincasa hispida]
MEGSRQASWFIFLILLFLLMFAEGRVEASMGEIDEKSKQIEMKDFIEATSSTQNPIIKMVTQMGNNIENSQDDKFPKKKNNNNDDSSSSSSHMNHNINPLLIVFFTINDLKVGKKLAIYFPKRDPSKSPPFLPKQKADQIPFAFKQLPHILSYFSFPPNSPQAQAIKETLQQCELKPIKGETKFCATSMESMMDFVKTSLIFPTKSYSSSSSSFKLLKTSHLTKSNVHFQNYTIFDTPMEIAAPKLVACHTMPYPYAIYYCHYQEGDNNVLKIELEGENGDRVEALAICHMDTSQWSSTHPAFQVLKLQPGDMPICHFFPADDFVWIPVA